MAAEQEPVYLYVAENATTCRKILARGGCDRCALRHCAPPWALYDAAPATLRGALRSALDVPQNEGCALCLGALAETTARAVARAATAHAGLGAARGEDGRQGQAGKQELLMKAFHFAHTLAIL